MANEVDKLEPSRGFRNEKHSPEVTVIAFIAALPMENREDVGEYKTWKYEQHREHPAGDMRKRIVRQNPSSQTEWEREESELGQTNKDSKFVGERVHSGAKTLPCHGSAFKKGVGAFALTTGVRTSGPAAEGQKN